MRRAGKRRRPGNGELAGQPQPPRDPAGSSGAEMTLEPGPTWRTRSWDLVLPHSPSPASLGGEWCRWREGERDSQALSIQDGGCSSQTPFPREKH